MAAIALCHFLMVADWSKNLILGLGSVACQGVECPVEFRLKRALLQPAKTAIRCIVFH